MAHFIDDTTGISRPQRRWPGWTGVMGSLLLTVTIFSGLTLIQPVVAAVFDECITKIEAQCLANAITAANQNGEANTIYLGQGTYALTKPLPSVTSPHWLTIQGMGVGRTSISGSYTDARKDSTTKECPPGADFSVLRVGVTGALWLDGVTIKNGQAGGGAGIHNEGSLQLRGSTIKSNHAHVAGGGLYNKGWAYLQDTTVLNNVVHNGRGGGIYIQSGLVEIAYSTINGNETINGHGAGIANGSVFKDEHGIWQKSGGVLSIYNSTISGNKFQKINSIDQPNAGGILNDGDGEVWLKSVTITTNAVPFSPSTKSPAAGGMDNRGQYVIDGTPFAESTFYFSNTIIAANVGGGKFPASGQKSDCRGPVISLGGNLVGSDTGCQIVPPDSWMPPGRRG